MICKETLVSLFDKLNETDQKTAYEFIKSMAHRVGEQIEHIEKKEVIQVFGKNYFVVPD